MELQKTKRFNWWRYSFLGYGVLLVISLLYQRFTNQDFEAPIFNAVGIGNETIVYIPDPFFQNNVLTDSLSKYYTVVTVGYNFDGNDTPDFSYEEYAAKLAEELKIQSITSFHLIGEGIGGSVALHLYNFDSNSVNSLILISGSGVEEQELMGRFEINRSIYLLQYIYHTSLKYLIPHFGAFDKIDAQIKRANIQYLSDQRKIRPLLAKVKTPVLIQHLPDFSKLPLQVSKEHNRLIPQSSFRVYERNKSTGIQDLIRFINSSIDGESLTREESTTIRVIQSLIPFNAKNNSNAVGNKLALLVLAIILATLISEDLTCIITGLMISQGLIGFIPGVLACLAGIFIGDILLFLAGKWLASGALTKAPIKWFITEQDIKKSNNWFKAKGPSIIIASRFIPGTRLPTYFSAGAIGASFWMFILYFGIASLIWTPILVGLAVLLGQEMMDYFIIYQEYALWILLGMLLFFYLLFKVVIPLFTYRGRRLLVGKWYRLTKWEFWSLTMVYAPVMIFIIGLWIKYRSITMFVASNPGIENGGFIKESKSAILKAIKLKEAVAIYHTVSNQDNLVTRTDSVLRFMNENELGFPVVLKPDIGERGSGVQILKGESELDIALSQLSEDHILQEYIEGEEYGVFYYRYPNQEKGQIYSITKKVYLNLQGDGLHTLEDLILKDRRAVCLAQVHLEKHAEKLYEIPDKGEPISLVEIGTHSRGALFFDADYLISDQLSSRIDEISKSFDGFYFGRYDIKVPSGDHLKRAKRLKVIELNGVTSESTNIYDPKHSFLFGLKTLMKQWSIAYEIGYQVKTKNKGFKLPSVRYLLSLLG